MQNRVYFAFILLILASFFWSGNFLTAKLAYNFNLSPLKLSFYRWLLAFIIILPFTLNPIAFNTYNTKYIATTTTIKFLQENIYSYSIEK